MKAVEGIYDGKWVKPLHPVHMPANARVTIMFADVPARPPRHDTRLKDVAGCLAYRGKAKTLADMEQAIKIGAKKRRS